MLDQYDDVMTTEEACDALKIGYNTLYELLNSGQLKGYRNGRTWRIPKLAIQEFILERAQLIDNFHQK
jgi:excisionase family DNA binding protein